MRSISQRQSSPSTSVLASLAVVGMFAAACGGSDSASESADTESPNPGAGFSGMYDVEMVETQRAGLPIDAEAATKIKFAWVVQSVCEESTGPCVAIASGTAPSPTSNLNRDRVELIYENGSWTRAVESIPQECKNRDSGEVITEDVVGIDSTTLTADSSANASPIARLTGRRTSILGGSCPGASDYDVTVTRTGDVPAGTAAPSNIEPISAAVTDSPGLAFSGTYLKTATRVATPDQEASTRGVRSENQFKVDPAVCTRDGKKCMVTMATADKGITNIYLYVDGHLEQTKTTVDKLPCAASSTGLTAYPQFTSRLEPDGTTPAGTVRGTNKYTYVGDCAGEYVDEVVFTRTGD